MAVSDIDLDPWYEEDASFLGVGEKPLVECQSLVICDCQNVKSFIACF